MSQRINKKDLAFLFAIKTGVSLDRASHLISVLCRTITSEVNAGNEIVLKGFGKFYGRDRKERTMVMVQQQQKQLIPAKTIPAFKPSETWKRTLSRDRQHFE